MCFHRADGTEEKKLGGIFHSVAALANIAADRDTIFPVFGVGETEFKEVKEAFSQYKNIDDSGIFNLSVNLITSTILMIIRMNVH